MCFQSKKKCCKSDQCTSIKISAWNIQGLESSIGEDVFNNFLSENDIVILTETWLKENISIRDSEFYNYHSLRQKHKRAKRPSGGISVLIRNTFRNTARGEHSIKFIKENEFVVWFKICKDHFNLPNDIFVGAAYLPPENSTIYKNKDISPFQILENDLLSFHAQGEIILMGDFNSRTGSLTDTVEVNLNDDTNGDDCLTQISALHKMGRFGRNSNDIKVNSFGKCLVELCKSANLKMLNGRSLGDLNGAYTCFQYNGRSLVDYCIVSDNLTNKMQTFKVSQPNHTSDHASIGTSISIDRFNMSQPHPLVDMPSVAQFKWDEQSSENYKRILQLPNFQTRCNKFLDKKYDDINVCSDELHNIFIEAAKLCVKLKKKKYKNHKQDKLGFDSECRQQKNQVLHLGKLVVKFPKDPVVYGQFITAKKSFKKLVKMKNWKAKNHLLNQICESEKKNPKLFWKLLNKLRESKKNNDSPIEMSSWKTHFQGLHNESIAEKPDESFMNVLSSKLNTAISQDNVVSLLDKPFTYNEISDTIKALKHGKAGGPDQILNDMIIASDALLTPCLGKLFNMILNDEQIPNSWSYGFLVPIFKKGDRFDPGNYRGISIVSCINKLFSKIFNERLVEYLDINKYMSCCQIGFARKKRTADHIFVLKCIIEEAKQKKQAIFGCFVDLKKAFDTVWRDGLFYKLLYQYKLSTRYVRILRNMYGDLQGVVKMNGFQSQTFPISIGLRQGCNLSPSLFNLYINDLPNLLEKAQCDPVLLHEKKINVLMYADDMLLLSKSEQGLQRAMQVLGLYCKRWQLVVNVSKTKVMVFNKTGYKKCSFPYNGLDVEVVKHYVYLGIKMSSSGSFTKATGDLYNSALRAYFSVRSVCSQNLNWKPRIIIKLFDTMVKPIILYCSEVLGAFNIKKTDTSRVIDSLMSNNKTMAEKLNIRMCKQILKLPKTASNIAARAELGRLPIMKSTIVAFCKYYARLHTFKDNDLLYHALKSQKSLESTNGKCFTYTEIVENCIKSLKIERPTLVTEQSLFNFGKETKQAIISQYKATFNNFLSETRISNESKLSVYAHLKSDYEYEKYLDYCNDFSSLTRFRTSCHWLPIERGRYHRPIIPRQQRLCTLCNVDVGTEFHSMFLCKSLIINDLQVKYMSKISDICPQINALNDKDKFIYLMSCKDVSLVSTLSDWIKEINQCYKDVI